MAKVLLKGNEKLDFVEATLQTAVQEFNSTLSHVGNSLHFRTFEVVEGRSLNSSDADVS